MFLALAMDSQKEEQAEVGSVKFCLVPLPLWNQIQVFHLTILFTMNLVYQRQNYSTATP